jgi:hypothetical protein
MTATFRFGFLASASISSFVNGEADASPPSSSFCRFEAWYSSFRFRLSTFFRLD